VDHFAAAELLPDREDGQVAIRAASVIAMVWFRPLSWPYSSSCAYLCSSSPALTPDIPSHPARFRTQRLLLDISPVGSGGTTSSVGIRDDSYQVLPPD
jgi:hypothetical protein